MRKPFSASSRLIPKVSLGEVVGAEGEELGVLGDFIGSKGRPRDLDHRAELVVDRDALLFHHLLGHRFQRFTLNLEFIDVADEWDHHLGMDLHALR